MKTQAPFFLTAERETHNPGLHALQIAGRTAPLAHARRTQRRRSAVREAVALLVEMLMDRAQAFPRECDVAIGLDPQPLA